MPLHHHHLHLLLTTLLVSLSAAAAAPFPAKFQPLWGQDHIAVGDDGNVILTLDRGSGGAGFISTTTYTSGVFSARMKLVPGDSAGTVSTFYLSSSTGDHRNEVDLEFLGNSSGEPYTLQTNIFVDGVGRREQGVRLWFDPTAAFHEYAILWNRHLVIFSADDTVIRVYRNLPGVAYPGGQAMSVLGSLWNGEDWATQGGRVRINWSHAPFRASFGGLRIGGAPAGLADLSAAQKRQLRWVEAKWRIY